MITIASNSWPSSATSLERFNSHLRTLANGHGIGSGCWLNFCFGERFIVFFGSVSTWKVDPKKTFPVKVMLNFLNSGKKGTQGHPNSGVKVFASTVTEGAENEFTVFQLTDVSSILSQDMLEIAKVVFSKIFKTIPSLKLT